MSGGNISNLFQDEEFDNLAGKLPRDIVNKIMSFWSPGYPFLEEFKLVFPKIVAARLEFAEDQLSFPIPSIDLSMVSGGWVDAIIWGACARSNIYGELW